MGFVYVCVTAADLAEIQTTNFKPKELWLKNMAKRCQKGMYGGVIYNKSIYVLIYIYTHFQTLIDLGASKSWTRPISLLFFPETH